MNACVRERPQMPAVRYAREELAADFSLPAHSWRYQATVRRKPSSKFTRILKPRCFWAAEISASECRMSPERDLSYLTLPLYPVILLMISKVSFKVTWTPQAKLNIFPATSDAGAVQASRLAETTLSM